MFWLLLVLGFFLFLTVIDYVVHHILYGYGLTFDFKWARPYWIAQFLLTFVVALMQPGWREAIVVLGLLAAGIIDWFFFMFQREVPKGNLWWLPWHRFHKPWTWKCQATLTVLILSFLIVFWWVT